MRLLWKDVLPRGDPMSHTPGPWTVPGATFAESQPGEMGTAYFVLGSDGRPISANAADADLIAAAPDLLEALEAFVAAYDAFEPIDGIAIQACTAIAKARGGEE